MTDLKTHNMRYPFPKEYMETYADRLFKAIHKEECATSVWVATAGRRVADRFIIDNISLFNELLPNYQKYLLAYIEPLDLTEESQAGYIRLIGRTFIEVCKKRTDLQCEFTDNEIDLFDSEQTSYPRLLDGLKNLISKLTHLGIEVVLFLGEFDELNFINNIVSNNLRSLWNKFDGKLHYVFLIKDLRLVFDQNPFGEELGYLFFQNLIYTPVSKDNEGYLLDYFQNKYNHKLTSIEKKVISEMCDGHPYFLKLAVESISKIDSSLPSFTADKIKELLRANHEIRATSDLIMGVFTEKMKSILNEIASKQLFDLPINEETDSLKSLGVVRKSEEGYYQIFCLLFRDAVLKRSLPEPQFNSGQKELYIDNNTNAIIFQGKPIEEKLTRQEYEILAYFLKEPNKVHSRDVLAETLWGKESYEKYSDWAIDQLMSKLRKKLTQLGLEANNLTTIRGRGYKFVY